MKNLTANDKAAIVTIVLALIVIYYAYKNIDYLMSNPLWAVAALGIIVFGALFGSIYQLFLKKG